MKKKLMSEFTPCSLSPQSSDSVVTTRYLQGDSDVGGGVAGTARQKRPLERCCGHGGMLGPWGEGEMLGPWKDAGSTEGCWGHVGRMLDHEGMLQPRRDAGVMAG